MGKEIERRYLVADHSIVDSHDGVRIVQGYLSKNSGEMSARIRVCGSDAWLTMKSPRRGIVRDEYEYPLPLKDAREILERHCAGRILSKVRYSISFGNHLFAVDVFDGALAGLVIAEIELFDPGEIVELPSWIGREISDDSRYGNRSLALFGIPQRGTGRFVFRQAIQESEQTEFT